MGKVVFFNIFFIYFIPLKSVFFFFVLLISLVPLGDLDIQLLDKNTAVSTVVYCAFTTRPVGPTSGQVS